MKVCENCGTENGNNATKCSACGSGNLTNKCDNCGTIFKTAFCPTCGVKAGSKSQKCPDCGEEYFSAACPKCGYSPARKAGERSANASNQPTIIVNQPAKKKTSFGIILLWIFFLPIMATIAVWKSQKLKKLWKIIITAAIWLFVLICSITNNGSTSATDDKSSLATSTAATAEATAEPTIEPTQKTSAATESEWTGSEAVIEYLDAAVRDYNPDFYEIRLDNEQRAYVVDVRLDDVTMIGVEAASGDLDALQNWTNAVKRMERWCISLKQGAEETGATDVHIALNVLKSEEERTVLIEILDGTTINEAVYLAP